MAECVVRLVDCESGTIGGNLEEDASGLPEINRLEIIAIQLRSHIVAERRQLGSDFELLRFVGAAECNVMYGARSHDTSPDTRHAAKIDYRSRTAVSTRVPKDASLLAHELKAECIGEKLSSELVGVEPERDRVQATNGVLSGYARCGPSALRIHFRMGNELTHESFVILECNHALVLIACSGLFELHPFFDESLDPEPD